MPADGGIRFGNYLLLRRIARGGMAEVFLAQQRGLEGFDRRVAVKRILPHLIDSPDFVKMFLGEAKLAAQLTHPNIASSSTRRAGSWQLGSRIASASGFVTT